MCNEPILGAPPSVFEKYSEINEAYASARRTVLSVINTYNNLRDDGLGFWAPGPPVMEFVRSCIPSDLEPAELGANTAAIEERIRKILYPYIEREFFTVREFAAWLGDRERAVKFTQVWLKSNDPNPKRGPQPRINLKKLVEAKLLSHTTSLKFKFGGREYVGKISDAYKVSIDLGEGETLFRSPQAVFSKGLQTTLQQWDYCFVPDVDGKDIPLGQVRDRYMQRAGGLAELGD